MRFGYADPAYPGLARKYYGKPETDHRVLVRELARDFPDGFALSTSARALPYEARDIRVCPWVRGSRPGKSRRARNAWEPLIVVGGRPTFLTEREQLDDVLVFGGRQRSHPGALVGMKPAAFAEWMFRLLGARRGDELVDLFPGSGAVSRAWRMFVGDASHLEAASRLAGASAALRSRLSRAGARGNQPRRN